jgi:thiamine-monophosphate kinase
MDIRELGEFGLIRRLIQRVREGRGETGNISSATRLLVDVGDDTAAWQIGDTVELFTTDTMVEGIHFTPQTTPWKDLGWKAMASNVSDIAAMGGVPLYALITLGLPTDTPVSDMDDLYEGMLEMGHEYGVEIIGGDVVGSPVAFISIALTGTHDGELLLRSSVRPGDQVAVTGWLGSSAGGLELMRREGVSASVEDAAFLREAHRRPRPCVAGGRILSENGVKAAMDVSDGLLDDLGKMCEASGVAARVRRDPVPVHPALKNTFPESYLELALGGGEDYQLLFAASPSVMERVTPLLPASAAVIGEITEGEPGKVSLLDSQGREVTPPKGGWDHFG